MNAPLKNPLLKDFYETGEYVQINGSSIFCFQVGDHKPERPAVLLLHGFPTSSFDWYKITPLLEQDVNLLGLDFLGFGFSDKPDERTYTIHKQTDLVEAFLKHKRITSTHILCHDYAVSVAQELLARHANSDLSFAIESCCFLNGGLFPETHRALLIQKLLLSPLGPLLSRFMGFEKFKTSFNQVFGASTKAPLNELEAFWELIQFKQGQHVFHNLITYMKDRVEHRERWLSALQSSQVPLALINGSEDPVSGGHLVRRYQELGCRLDFLTELNTIGHYPHVEAPRAVASAYRTFLLQLNQSNRLKQ